MNFHLKLNNECIVSFQGFGKLSLVAASAAQSAANAVQAGTKELTTKVLSFRLMLALTLMKLN